MNSSRMLYSLLSLLVAVGTVVLPSKAEDANGNPYRLPASPFPLRYTIKMQPLFELMIVRGSIQTDLVVNAASFDRFADDSDDFSIQLNRASDLSIDIESIRFKVICGNQSRMLYAESEDFNSDYEISDIKFNQKVSSVKEYTQGCISNVSAVLSAVYNATLRTDQTGFYISKYAMADSTIVSNAVTRFNTGAKAAYPCWDEPIFKAKMKVSMIVPNNAVALTNTPIQSETEMDRKDCSFTFHNGSQSSDCKLISFVESPPISTYLTSFVVGDYQAITTNTQLKNKRTMTVRIWVPQTYNSYTSDFQFALDDLQSILPFYEDLFQVEYPFDQIDCIGVTSFPAIPETTVGMVMLRPYLLSVRQSSKTGISTTIADKVVQLWFGDMVSIEWWNNLWLVESFSNYVELTGVNYTHPEQNHLEWVLRATDYALNADIDPDIAPVQKSVENPENIDDIIQDSAYDKGRAVIRLLAEMIGSSSFFSGVKDYLVEYRFGNANSNDLWRALQTYTQNDTNITDVMNDWVLTSGFPLVSVSIEDEMDDTLVFKLEQSRMLNKFQALNESGYDNHLWKIPILLTDASGNDHNMGLFTTQEMKINVKRHPLKNGNEYYLFNPIMNGPFRINYDDTLINIIINSFNELSQEQQYTLLSDQFALMDTGYITLDIFLERFTRMISSLNEYMDNNPDQYINEFTFGVWDKISFALLNLQSRFCEFGIQYSFDFMSTVGVGKGMYNQAWVLEDPDTLLALQRHAKQMVFPVWNLIGGWNTDLTMDNPNADTIKEIRTKLAYLLVYIGEEHTIQSGYQLMDNVNFDINQVDPDLLQHLIAASLRYKPTQTFEWLKNSIADWSASQRRKGLSAMGTLNFDESLMIDAVNFALSYKVRDNERVSALFGCRVCHGRFAVWNQVFEDEQVWESIVNDQPSYITSMTRIPESFATFYMLDEYQSFFFDSSAKSHLTDENANQVNRTVNSILILSNWLVNSRDATREWLDLNGYVYTETIDDSSSDESEGEDEDDDDDDDSGKGETAALILAGAFFFTAVAIISYRAFPPKDCKRFCMYRCCGCCCRPSGYSRQSQDNDEHNEEYEYEDDSSGTRTAQLDSSS